MDCWIYHIKNIMSASSARTCCIAALVRQFSPFWRRCSAWICTAYPAMDRWAGRQCLGIACAKAPGRGNQGWLVPWFVSEVLLYFTSCFRGFMVANVTSAKPTLMNYHDIYMIITQITLVYHDNYISSHGVGKPANVTGGHHLVLQERGIPQKATKNRGTWWFTMGCWVWCWNNLANACKFKLPNKVI